MLSPRVEVAAAANVRLRRHEGEGRRELEANDEGGREELEAGGAPRRDILEELGVLAAVTADHQG